MKFFLKFLSSYANTGLIELEILIKNLFYFSFLLIIIGDVAFFKNTCFF